MPTLSQRVLTIAESQTVALTSLIAKLKKEGKDIVALGAGEPDFDTPAHIKNAGVSAIQNGFNKYTPVDGIFELKARICEWLKKEYSVEYNPSEVIITPGAKFAVYQALAAVCNPGDEVLLPLPYWVSYPEQIKLTGARPIPIKTTEETGLKITPEQLEAAITKKTKALILNSPNNPTGAVYSRNELAALAEIIKESGIYVLSDEVYDQIIYDDKKFTSLAEFKSIREQLLLVNGVSKSFAMTGWRIGFLAAHKEIISAVIKHQGHTTSNPTSVSQMAAVTAYRQEKNFLTEMKSAFTERRNYVYDRLNAINKVSCIKPQGAFYTFPNFRFYCNNRTNGETISNSMQLCKYLLEKFDVAIVPGSAFGMEYHARLSFATSMQNLEKALNRITAGLLSLN